MTNQILGKNLYIVGWSLIGNLPVEESVTLLEKVVQKMGMTTGGMLPIVNQFPSPNNKGGIGTTIYLPFGEEETTNLSWWQSIVMKACLLILNRVVKFSSTVFQPLVESFCVLDEYPEHEKTYILAVSCIKFETKKVDEYLEKHFERILEKKDFML